MKALEKIYRDWKDGSLFPFGTYRFGPSGVDFTPADRAAARLFDRSWDDPEFRKELRALWEDGITELKVYWEGNTACWVVNGKLWRRSKDE